MQPGASQSALSRQGLQTSPQAVEADQPLVQDEAAREHEEMRMLMLGFATGMLIAAVFLVYIVIAFAGVLP